MLGLPLNKGIVFCIVVIVGIRLGMAHGPYHGDGSYSGSRREPPFFLKKPVLLCLSILLAGLPAAVLGVFWKNEVGR